MEKVARGRNFTVSADEAEIFHASAHRDESGLWLFRDPNEYVGEVQIDVEKSMLEVEKYLYRVHEAGDMDRAKILLIRPMMALTMFACEAITIEQFQAARERSNGYFDVPETDFADFPVRVAQFPKHTLIVADERGYPVSAE